MIRTVFFFCCCCFFRPLFPNRVGGRAFAGSVSVPPASRATVRVRRPRRRLCEALRKSPQCDNWLPGVLVSRTARHRRPLQDGRGAADRRVCLNLFGEEQL